MEKSGPFLFIESFGAAYAAMQQETVEKATVNSGSVSLFSYISKLAALPNPIYTSFILRFHGVYVARSHLVGSRTQEAITNREPCFTYLAEMPLVAFPPNAVIPTYPSIQ